MTALHGMYDPGDRPDAAAGVLPAGVYAVTVARGGMRRTRAGTGRYLHLELVVVEGEHAGRTLVHRFNFVNPSAAAVRIANGEFAALRRAAGVANPANVEDLCGPRFRVVVVCEKRRDDASRLVNAVRRFLPPDGNGTTPRQRAGEAPWARNAPKAPAAPPPADEGPLW